MTSSDWTAQQYGPPPGPPDRPKRRAARLRAVAFALSLLLVAGVAVVLSHVAWRTGPSASQAAASLPSVGSGNTGNSGGSGHRSSGASNGSRSRSFAPPGGEGFVPGTGGEGQSPFGSSSTGSSGGPSDASSIAAHVDSGLVDINTTLSYESEEAAGTGMVLTSNGEVVTNNHVIEGATSISVTDVGNGKTYGASVVGYDRHGDVAVLQLEHASGLQRVRLGNSSDVSTGEEVLGIGNAGGSGGTPSYAGGSVTALDQSITASDDGGDSEQLNGLIETNADIQPGDSGGPLVNGSGQVIGMDTAALAGFSFEQAGSSTNESYSIPIDKTLEIAREITAGKASSSVHVGPTAFLGVEVTSPGATGGYGGPGNYGAYGGFGGDLGQSAPAPTSTGAEIQSVLAGSPAATAHLTAGDTITSLGGQSVSSPDSLTTIIEAEKPGDSLSLVYVDPSGDQQRVTVELASGPPQ